LKRLIACLLVVSVIGMVPITSAADPTAADMKPPAVGELIHDLRDFLPESESKQGKPDDPLPAFSTKDDGYWKKYRRYNKNGTGLLSRTEIIVLVADLAKSLRVNYPEVYADIDTDGDDTITEAKFSAYVSRKQK
jgi:hypothetical protein